MWLSKVRVVGFYMHINVTGCVTESSRKRKRRRVTLLMKCRTLRGIVLIASGSVETKRRVDKCAPYRNESFQEKCLRCTLLGS